MDTPPSDDHLAASSLDEAAFWRTVEDLRARGQGDPEAMAELLKEELSAEDDAAVVAFQHRYLDLAAELYTWRQWQGAEMACGFVSDDVFSDWRAWIIAHGQETFERVAADADALAELPDLAAGCRGVGELFGAAALNVYFARHDGDDGLDVFPFEDLEQPSGPRLQEHAAIRADLPRLSARIPRDGLGKGPGSYVDRRPGLLTRLLGRD